MHFWFWGGFPPLREQLVKADDTFINNIDQISVLLSKYITIWQKWILTDWTKSAALSRLSGITCDANVLQSCPSERRRPAKTLGSPQTVLHEETLIHMFWSWDDKSLISLFPKKHLLMIPNRPRLAADRVSPRTTRTISLWKWEVDWLSTTFHIFLFVFASTLFSCSLINTECATG